MYFNLITTVGIILIVSSFISIIFLLRKNVKQCVKSFTFVLILSDVLSNIFIGVLLLVKQLNVTHDIQEETEIRILRGYNNSSDNNTIIDQSNNYLPNNECDFMSLLMNYVIVIVPFVNNFMSVLSKSLYCNYTVGCVKDKSNQLSMKNIFSGSTSIDKLRSRVRLLKNLTNNNIFTIISVVGQWAIPIISVILLYLTGYENVTTYVRSYELKCLDMMNFPFDNCHSNISNSEDQQFNGLDTIESLDDISVINSTDSLLQNNYNDSKLNAIELIASNSSETNKIIFKIQEIVQSALNNSQDIPEWYFSNPTDSKFTNLELKNREGKLNLEENLFDNELTMCMINKKCIIPPNVLKTHMMLLIFIIYFGSILLSTVYCIKSNYICLNIKQQLESMGRVTGDKQESVGDEKENKTIENTSSDDIEWVNSCSCLDVPSAENIKEETSDAEKIIFICKMCVLLVVLLWTPILIQLIVKIFMCMESNWSINLFYLAAMSYGVITNFLNVDMVKSRGIVPQV